jgi:hypothetical protein
MKKAYRFEELLTVFAHGLNNFSNKERRPEKAQRVQG